MPAFRRQRDASRDAARLFCAILCALPDLRMSERQTKLRSASTARGTCVFWEAKKKGADRGVISRHAIYRAFFEELGSVGYEALTVGAIVKRAAVSKGRFYHHFRGKNDLAEKALRALAADVLARVSHAMREGVPLVEALVVFLESLREVPFEGRRGLLELFCISMTDTELRPTVRAQVTSSLSAGVALLEEEKRLGRLSPGVDTLRLARRLYTGCLGVVLVHAALGDTHVIVDELQLLLREDLAVPRAPKTASRPLAT